MVKNLLAVSVGAQKPTVRDNYRFKRFITSGALIKNLFTEYFKLQQNDIYTKMDKEYFYNNTSDTYQNEDFIKFVTNNRNHYFKERIVETGFRKAFKGKLGGTSTYKNGWCSTRIKQTFIFWIYMSVKKNKFKYGNWKKNDCTTSY